MTGDSFDTMDALMARYVAGALPLPAHVLVQAHLDIRTDNRRFVEGLEDMAGQALEEIEPLAVSDRDGRLDAIFASSAPPSEERKASGSSSSIMPPVLSDFIGFDVEHVPWRTKLPGFREYEMGDIDGCHASMFWIKPGRAIPSHTHEGFELTLVLDGAFSDIAGRYERGDISIADEAVDHRPVAGSGRPCICFAVTDAPLKLTGSVGRRLADIIGL